MPTFEIVGVEGAPNPAVLFKVCRKCGEKKLLTQFSPDKRSRCGVSARCKSCRNTHVRAYHRAREGGGASPRHVENKKKLLSYQLEHPCVKCGETHPAKLEFHHRDPVHKEYGIASMLWRYDWPTIQREIDKCDVLCANCHKLVTAQERNYYSIDPWYLEEANKLLCITNSTLLN